MAFLSQSYSNLCGKGLFQPIDKQCAHSDICTQPLVSQTNGPDGRGVGILVIIGWFMKFNPSPPLQTRLLPLIDSVKDIE